MELGKLGFLELRCTFKVCPVLASRQRCTTATKPVLARQRCTTATKLITLTLNHQFTIDCVLLNMPMSSLSDLFLTTFLDVYISIAHSS